MVRDNYQPLSNKCQHRILLPFLPCLLSILSAANEQEASTTKHTSFYNFSIICTRVNVNFKRTNSNSKYFELQTSGTRFLYTTTHAVLSYDLLIIKEHMYCYSILQIIITISL